MVSDESRPSSSHGQSPENRQITPPTPRNARVMTIVSTRKADKREPKPPPPTSDQTDRLRNNHAAVVSVTPPIKAIGQSWSMSR